MNERSFSRITYHGPPRLAGALAEMLRNEAGCDVHYRPPHETRDALGVAALAVSTVQFVVQATGTDDRIKAVVDTFVRRYSRAQVRVTVDGQASDDATRPDSLADELAKLASLHSEGHLTDEEFSQAKARLLHHGS
ncbi:SHOCT domain-containing protein [Streptomyces sp. NPDC050788]|jgi:hypothetical protein|uniref:SHOCT domain-containing protein n=1 Tax=Streptomyces sp. NPDC050788 TaxID=3155041 RepID=UPI00344880F8